MKSLYFTWNIGDNPLSLSDQQRTCVRVALGDLMGWTPGSAEYQTIPLGPPATDLKRLVEECPELGLEWHGEGEHLSGEMRGIIIGEVMTPYGRSGHAEFGERIGDKADMFISIMGVITNPEDMG